MLLATAMSYQQKPIYIPCLYLSMHSNHSHTMHPHDHHHFPSAQTQWITTVRQLLSSSSSSSSISDDQSVSIFDVPKPLLTLNPELYAPQIVSLGPYHRLRDEVKHMERYKVASAKSVQSQLRGTMRFQDLVEVFESLEYRIRAHYHRHLDITGETLAWMMAIDAAFLFEFLQKFTNPNNNNNNNKSSIQRIPSRMMHLLLDSKYRTTTTHSTIIRDVVMLENQIPLFLLLKVAETQTQLQRTTEETVRDMLVRFFNEISPFKKLRISHADVKNHPHLLDFLYCNIVPREDENCGSLEEDDKCDERDNAKSPNLVENFAISVRSFVSDRLETLISFMTRFLVQIPLRIMQNVPMLSVLSAPVERILSSENDTHENDRNNNEPLLEEILIPSVTELTSSGIKIRPTDGGISTVDFDSGTATLHLPTIALDVNSEVVLRNLIAYEASFGSSGPLILSRYVEFMNGIVDTDADARILRKKGVILNYLKSDGDVAELWNGMTRSVRLTRVPRLDRVIEGVNRFYDSKWKVILKRFLRKHNVVSVWKCVICVVLLVPLVLFVMGFQVICSTSRCGPGPSRKGP